MKLKPKKILIDSGSILLFCFMAFFLLDLAAPKLIGALFPNIRYKGVELHNKQKEDVRAHQKRYAFSYIRTSIHNDDPQYNTSFRHVLNENSRRYYWAAWKNQKLIPQQVRYSADKESITIRFNSTNDDGHIIFKQTLINDPYAYCSSEVGFIHGGPEFSESPKIEIIEFRKDSIGNIKEHQIHHFGYSAPYLEKDCNRPFFDYIFYFSARDYKIRIIKYLYTIPEMMTGIYEWALH